MPQRPAKPCNAPGCPELIRNGRYCDKHKKETAKQIDERRGSSASRGYDSRWQKVRDLCLRQQPLCHRCQEQGIVRPADLVHHIQSISKGGDRLVFNNLMSLCTGCHDFIHREQGDKW